MKKILHAMFVAMMAAAGSAVSAPVTVTGYDILHTPLTGHGGWGHAYAGSILPDGSGAFNYSLGVGTINDSVIGTSESVTHLLDSSRGPVITLHLGAMVTVSSIRIWGGNIPGNAIPGQITGVSVSVGGPTMAFATTALGMPVASGLADDLVTLTGSGLDLIATDTIMLSLFFGPGCCGAEFFPSITEITIEGALAAVPEPGALALFGLGLLAFRFARRARQEA